MTEYIENPSATYKKLAEKYGVAYSVIAREAAQKEWVKKRKQKNKDSSGKNGKLSLLQKAADKSIQSLYSKLFEDDLSINDIKNISGILKTLTAVQRDLNDLPTFKEKNSLRISDERLKLVKTKISSGEEEGGETGVVLIPFLDEEDEDEDVVYEGEESV